MYDSIYVGQMILAVVTQNAYSFVLTKAPTFQVVPVEIQYYAGGGNYDGSCVAQDSIVYVALTEEEEPRLREDIVVFGEEGMEETIVEIQQRQQQLDSLDETNPVSGLNESATDRLDSNLTLSSPRIIKRRFVQRAIGELKEGDRVLSSFTGSASDCELAREGNENEVDPGNASESESNYSSATVSNNNNDNAHSPFAICLRDVKTSEVRLVTRKPVNRDVPIVRIDDEFLITRGHPILRARTWMRPDEAWPVIEMHVHELINVYLEPLPTFVVGRNRWICGGLGGDYGRVAELHPENDDRFGRGFKKRYEAHLKEKAR
jgi:hypothetical protein